MARPKKANKDDIATVKIENAFWKLIETGAYADITVLRITQEAGTNRNSFYYHYRDIEDLAYKAFRNNVGNDVSKELLNVLISAVQSPENASIEIEPSILPHSKRIMLCAGSDSAFLNNMVRNLLKDIWFEYFSIDEEMLSTTERLQVIFIFAGLVAALGSEEVKDSPHFISVVSQTEIGKATIRTLKAIASSQNNSGK